MVLDAALALLVLGVAVWTVAAGPTFAAVVGFVAFGLLLALVWVRLAAVDVALTEAAIGSGVTGAAAHRRGRTPAPDRATSGSGAARPRRCVSRPPCSPLLVAAGLAALVLLPAEPAPTLAPAAAAHLPELDVGNPVTAVLLAYRSLDTLLEKVVLLLALIGVWSLAPDRFWGGAPGLRPGAARRRTDPACAVAAAHRYRRRHLHPVGRSDRAGRSLPGRRDPRRNVAAGHDRRLAESARDRPTAAAACAGRRDRRFSWRSDLRDLPCRTASSLTRRSIAKPLIIAVEVVLTLVHRRDPRTAGRRPTRTRTAAMSAATLYGLCSAALVGLGLFGAIVHPQPLRKILAFNLLGGGVFLLFGVIARRGAAAGMGGDPVPQAMVITGIVVAFSATALAVALLLRLYQVSGSATLSTDTPARPDGEWRRSLIPQTAGFLLVLAIVRAGGRRGAGDGARWPPGRTHRPGGDAGRVLHRRSRSPPTSGCTRTPLIYHVGGWRRRSGSRCAPTGCRPS